LGLFAEGQPAPRRARSASPHRAIEVKAQHRLRRGACRSLRKPRPRRDSCRAATRSRDARSSAGASRRAAAPLRDAAGGHSHPGQLRRERVRVQPLRLCDFQRGRDEPARASRTSPSWVARDRRRTRSNSWTRAKAALNEPILSECRCPSTLAGCLRAVRSGARGSYRVASARCAAAQSRSISCMGITSSRGAAVGRRLWTTSRRCADPATCEREVNLNRSHPPTTPQISSGRAAKRSDLGSLKLCRWCWMQIGPSERSRMRLRDVARVVSDVSVCVREGVVRRGNAAAAALSSCLIRKRPSRPIS
jgi:hypothetical protein